MPHKFDRNKRLKKTQHVEEKLVRSPSPSSSGMLNSLAAWNVKFIDSDCGITELCMQYNLLFQSLFLSK